MDCKNLMPNIESVFKNICDKLKTDTVLGVPTCSPLFKDSVKFSKLRSLEKKPLKQRELDEITFQKKKILKKYSSLQLDKMEEIIKYLEKV